MTNFSEVVYYDPTSPSFLRWKVDRFTGRKLSRKHISAGDVAGHFNAALGYYTVSIDNKAHYAHRIVAELHGMDVEHYEVDHKDKDRSNNAFTNLRRVGPVLNRRNQSKRCDNTSGVTGVAWSLSRFSTLATACWMDENGKQKRKSFSVGKNGLAPAFRLACAYRDKMILELNERGGGYTDKHGE